jgi:hypothetical protein
MTVNECDEGMTNVINDNAFNSNRSDIDGAFNSSNRRSTSTGNWHNGAGDESRVSSRREHEQHLEELASKETHAVTKLKILVSGSLFFSMVAVAHLAYFFTAQGERQSFEAQFYDDANKILGNTGNNLQRTMEVTDAFITSIISFAAHTNQTWPNAVIPDFSVTAEEVRSLC